MASFYLELNLTVNKALVVKGNLSSCYTARVHRDVLLIVYILISFNELYVVGFFSGISEKCGRL